MNDSEEVAEPRKDNLCCLHRALIWVKDSGDQPALAYSPKIVNRCKLNGLQLSSQVWIRGAQLGGLRFIAKQLGKHARCFMEVEPFGPVVRCRKLERKKLLKTAPCQPAGIGVVRAIKQPARTQGSGRHSQQGLLNGLGDPGGDAMGYHVMAATNRPREERTWSCQAQKISFDDLQVLQPGAAGQIQAAGHMIRMKIHPIKAAFWIKRGQHHQGESCAATKIEKNEGLTFRFSGRQVALEQGCKIKPTWR